MNIRKILIRFAFFIFLGITVVGCIISIPADIVYEFGQWSLTMIGYGAE